MNKSASSSPPAYCYDRCVTEDHEMAKLDNQDAEHATTIKSKICDIDPNPKAFDPHQFGNTKNPTSFLGVVVHIFVIAASPTLMNIPSTFDNVGYLVGFMGCFVMVALYANSMHRIVSVEYTLCQQLHKPSLSYAKVIYHSFARGPRRFQWLAGFVKQLVNFNFVCIWSGGNSIFVLLACENIQSIYKYLYGIDVSIRLVVVWLTVPLVLLCWIPNLRLLVVCSSIANILNTTCIVIIMYLSLSDFPSIETRKPLGNVSSIPLFLGTVLITINATGLMIPLKNELKSPRQFTSKFGVLNVSYIPVCFLYSCFGLICYLKYGSDIQENVVLNMRDTQFGNLLTAFYTLGIGCMYPLVSYITYDTIWTNMLKYKLRNRSMYSVYEYVFRTINAMSSVIFAFVVPDISLLVSLTGTVGTSLDSLMLPAVAELLVLSVTEGSRMSRWHVLKNLLFIGFGTLLCVVGLWDSLSATITYYSDERLV